MADPEEETGIWDPRTGSFSALSALANPPLSERDKRRILEVRAGEISVGGEERVS